LVPAFSASTASSVSWTTSSSGRVTVASPTSWWPPDTTTACTREVALALPATEDFAYVRLAEAPPRDGEWDVGIQRVLTVSPSVYANGQMLPYPFDEDPHVSVLYDRIPPGEVEVRHESDVTAVDGVWIGHLESLTIDARGAITAMTFERGHLWRRRHITVPTSALAKVTMDGLTLALSKPQIAALEPAGRAAAL
jgi:hypothetical protein